MRLPEARTLPRNPCLSTASCQIVLGRRIVRCSLREDL
jgi:hypothetical protein